MLTKFGAQLPQHRFLGQDPDTRPLWGKEQNKRASLLFTAILRAAFPDVLTFHLIRLNAVRPETRIVTLCLEVNSRNSPNFNARENRRGDLCARLALPLLRPADFRPGNPAKAFYYEKSQWSLDEFTAHETIEQNVVLYEEVTTPRTEVRGFFLLPRP